MKKISLDLSPRNIWKTRHSRENSCNRSTTKSTVTSKPEFLGYKSKSTATTSRRIVNTQQGGHEVKIICIGFLSMQDNALSGKEKGVLYVRLIAFV